MDNHYEDCSFQASSRSELPLSHISKVYSGLQKDGASIIYHVINCPDDVNLGDLQWKFTASMISREDNLSGIVDYHDLRPGFIVRMKPRQDSTGK